MATETIPHRAAQVRSAFLAAVLAGCVVAFLWLMRTVAAGKTRALDDAAMEWVASRRVWWLTAIARDLTALGSSTLLAVLSGLVFAVLWTSARRIAAVETALASIIASVLTRTLKLTLARARPPLLGQLTTAAGFSFPSGHASGIAALLTAVALVTGEAVRSRAQRLVVALFYTVLIAGVAGTRVYLGVHYPSDVLAGICVGVASALIAHGITRTRHALRWMRSTFAARRGDAPPIDV